MKNDQSKLFGDETETEKELVQKALAVPFERKVSNSLALLRLHEKRALAENVKGYHVCDSFGKDSDCIVHLAKLAGVVHGCHHSFTTIDPPELIRFGRAHRPETIVHRSPHGHLITQKMVAKANPPTRLGRWCCELYKETGGDGSTKIIGVRAEESPRRAALWREVIPNKRGGTIIAPILYWTTADVWRFHREHDLPYCSLYDEGFKRLGCVGCPLAGVKGQDKEFARWPGYERLWKKGFSMLWEQWHGVPTERERICVVVRIGGKAFAGNRVPKKELSDALIDRLNAEPIEAPLLVDGRELMRTRQRFFEKYQSPEGFYNWWRSGGKFDPSTAQCVFSEMMEAAGLPGGNV